MADGRAFWAEALMLLSFAGGNMPLALCALTLRQPDGPRPRRAAIVILLAACAIDAAATGEIPVLYSGGSGAVGLAVAQAAAAALALRAAPQVRRPVLVAFALILAALAGAPPDGPQHYAVAAVYVLAAVSIGYERIAVLPWLTAGTAAVAVVMADRRGVARDLALAVLPIALGLAALRLGQAPAVMSAAAAARRWSGVVIIAAALAAGVVRVTLAGTINYTTPEDRAVANAARWLRAHSHPDELVLPLDIMEFSTLSRRPVWVDQKMGGAVMWQPSFYPLWHERMAAVKQLTTLDAALAYARDNGIDYIVMRRADQDRLGVSGGAPVLHANDYVAVLSTARGSDTGDAPPSER